MSYIQTSTCALPQRVTDDAESSSTISLKQASTIAEIRIEAFAAFGGLARTLLYDNLKSVVLERVGEAIRFNPEFLAFAQHYRFEPRPVAVARGNEKGRVERHIDFIRKSFFAAREFTDVADLNAQARSWCEGKALDRPWPQDDALTVRQAFELVPKNGRHEVC